MDVVNIGRSQRFLRERPIRVNLFDRPRVVLDLLCLEPGQEESRRGLDTSDSVVLLMEGKGRIDTHTAIEELEEMDAVLVPPGVDHRIINTGEGRLVAVVMVTPKPTRASEVRVPGERRPARSYPRTGATPQPGNGDTRDDGRERRPPRTGAPSGSRGRQGDSDGGPNWYPKAKPAWRPRGAPPSARGGRPAGAGRGPGGPRPYGSRPGAPRRDDGGDREGSDGPRRWTPRPQSGFGGRGRPAGTPYGNRQGSGGTGEERRPPRSEGGRDSADRPQRGGGANRAGGGFTPRGARPGGNKKTGDARRASRGQGPLSGRRGPGRSGPRT